MSMDPDQISAAVETNLEIAMRALARAGALEDQRWAQHRVPDAGRYTVELDALHNAGAFWLAARAWCAELGRDMEMLKQGAEHYANGVIAGSINVTN